MKLALETHQAPISDFASWRDWARSLLTRGIEPGEIDWQEGDAPAPPVATASGFTVPKQFLSLAERVAAHRDPEKWALLYTALWRLNHGEKTLFEVLSDPLVVRLHEMNKAIGRDIHKTKAFVRFRKVMLDMPPPGQEAEPFSARERLGSLHEQEANAGAIKDEWYIAWHRPDHLIIPLAAPFFQRRFGNMNFALLTPDQSAWWDQKTMRFGPGVPREEAPEPDTLEDLWKQYYRSTFNPARIKLKMMKSEMAVKHWSTLPETQMIPQMLAEAPQRVAEMLKHSEGVGGSAADFLPENDHDLDALRAASKGCQGCPLYGPATQTVFGEGPGDARLILVGEQPGDKEDQAGRPFIGPAGKMLDEALREVGLNRDDIYITNAVKHFKFTIREFRPGQEMRWHRNPAPAEIRACKPWLQKEIETIKPSAVLCLGVSAAKSLISHGFVLKRQRQQWFDTELCRHTAATYHPASILRLPDAADRKARFEDLVKDLHFAHLQSAAA